MSGIDNFIPQWWNANVIVPLRKSAVWTSDMVVNRNYEGSIKSGGSTVNITQIGDVTVSDYTKNSTTITYAPLDAAALKLEVNQAKYFSFIVDSIDRAQAAGDVSMAGLEQASYKLKDAEDSYVAQVAATQAGQTSGLGTASTPLDITAADTATTYTGIVDLLGKLSTALDVANVTTVGRYVVLPPTLKQKLIKASILDVRAASANEESFRNGMIGTAMGFNVLISNNCYNYGTSGTPKWSVVAGVPSAITFAEQITEIEALKIQGQFGDAVRGLINFGAKATQADAIARAICTVAAG